ncbi:MAG: 50S ribosomal protein L17 [Waddliaceae bacterium]|nr:50S ribosomal protein L17 [Waddliaceae bacterium]
MRHRKHTAKLGRTTSHRRCMVANMLKSLVVHGSIQTTVAKAKEVRRHADRLITIAKDGSLAARRRAIAKLMIRFNSLTPKQARRAREGDQNAFNDDRKVIGQLFDELGPRFAERNGGYTRIVRSTRQSGDNTEKCVLQFVE